MGVRGIPETYVDCNDLEVHESMALKPLGDLRKGFATLMNAYNAQRVGVESVALGIAISAFVEALQHTKERKPPPLCLMPNCHKPVIFTSSTPWINKHSFTKKANASESVSLF
jgi:alkylation response protein AidB-like acyl-CoA dehydrogenase